MQKLRISLREFGVVSKAFRALLAVALIIPLVGFGSIESWFAPSKKLWVRWTTNDPASTAEIDHTPWSIFLRKYLVPGEVSRVRYLEVTPADRRALDGYVGALAALEISHYNRAQQLAYWINLYNALTISVVLKYYPINSIRDIDISPGLFVSGPWDKDLVVVEGEPLTLNDIEHRILRPIWNDPRLHYALNCASLGCPNLQPIPYTADNADGLLEKAAREFINTRGVRMINGKVTVSSIYAWFTEDFGGNETGVLNHLRHYAAPALAALLGGIRKIDGDSYDWRLNDIDRP